MTNELDDTETAPTHLKKDQIFRNSVSFSTSSENILTETLSPHLTAGCTESISL